MEKAFKQRGADRVWVQDTLDYGSGLFRRLYANLYIDLSEKTPELWGFAYHESNRDQSRFERQLRQLYSRIGVYKVDELNHLRPDAILCTHFLPIDAAINSLAPAGLKAPVFCVVTDYVGHPFWAHPGIAGTFVGNGMTADMLVSHGVPRSNLHVTGIPVNPDIALPKNVDGDTRAETAGQWPRDHADRQRHRRRQGAPDGRGYPPAGGCRHVVYRSRA